MKTAFIFSWSSTLTLTLGLAGCVGFDDDLGSDSGPEDGGGGSDGEDSGPESDGGDGDCPGCESSHDLRGELMLILNGRLTSADSDYWNNAPLDEDGTYVGSELFLYDPARVCPADDPGCAVVSVGNVMLDERLGVASVTDQSLRKFTLRDVAWHPEEGLWAVTFDSKNDEWGLGKLGVPDWHTSENEIDIERWVVHPSLDAQEPGADPCYWYESVSGLAFFQDELLLGVRGVGGVGLETNGMVFSVDLDVFDEGHCVYANDVSQDPLYYACDVVCAPWARFETRMGVAGDIDVAADGTAALAVVRAEDETLMPTDRMQLFRMEAPSVLELSDPEPTPIMADGFYQGLEMEGSARIGGRLFLINTLGQVYEVDDDAGTMREHADLGPILPGYPDGVKLRGATRVVVD